MVLGPPKWVVLGGDIQEPASLIPAYPPGLSLNTNAKNIRVSNEYEAQRTIV